MPSEITSFHVHRAREGDAESLAWLVARLTPLLCLQASYRLPGELGRLYDPEDIVNDVWLAVIPKLSTLGDRDGRWTPVLLKYLGTAVLRRVNQLFRKHLLGKPVEGPLPADPSLSAHITGALTRAAGSEVKAALDEAIGKLTPREREIVVLRGIEQVANETAAELLGEKSSTVAMRYLRALEKLRGLVPGSVFEELAAEIL
jgi:RNA polymerase sigma-70 factor (ECF subfamily)